METGTIDRLATVDVQKDWDQAVENGEKFWVSWRKTGEKSVRGCVHHPPSSSLTGSNDFVITDISKKSLKVCYTPSNMSTVFLAPDWTIPLHKDRILCMDISPSGGLGVASSTNGKLWIWDTSTGEKRRQLSGHVGDVASCRFFPSGVVVLSGGMDMRLKIWSAQDRTCPRTFIGHTREITATAIIDRGRNVVSTSSDGTVRLWDCGQECCLGTLLSLPSAVLDCDIVSCPELASSSPCMPLSAAASDLESRDLEVGTEGKLIVAACEDGRMCMCDVRNRKKVMEHQCGSSPVNTCAFLGPQAAICGNADGIQTLVDLRKPEVPLLKVSFGGSSAVTALRQSKNGRVVAGCADGTCFSWDPKNPGATVVKFTGPDIDPISSVCLVADFLYTSCRDGSVRSYQII